VLVLLDPMDELFSPKKSVQNGIALQDPATGMGLSYEDLAESVRDLARQLNSCGVHEGDRIAMAMPNSIETIVTFLAIARLGASALPLNPALTTTEVAAAFGQLQPRAALVNGTNHAAAVERICGRLNIPVLTIANSPRPGIVGVGRGRQSLPGHDSNFVALLLQTSGTTGRPKIVPLSQGNLASSAQTISITYELGRDDVTLCLMPLFHVHGLVGSALSTLVSGGTVVVPSRVRMSSFWTDVVANGVTWFSAVPTVLAKIPAPTSKVQDDMRLRFARASSSASSPSLIASFEAMTGVPLVEAYGMTEASHQMSSNLLPPKERRPGTVGRPTGTQIAIVDEGWNRLPGDTSGEVIVTGPGVISGYLDNDEANAASFREHWFRTGDLGVLSGDGYLTLVGRIKELINRGGEKISPREVDEVLVAHPAVAEAVTYGVPDEKYGEAVHAAVVLRDTIEMSALLTHCAEHLAPFKVPRALKFVDSIPKSPTGKIQRSAIAHLIEG
jgi:acyl-CoA synthetase (AMP-forming)/AMP-acid ligase II